MLKNQPKLAKPLLSGKGGHLPPPLRPTRQPCILVLISECGMIMAVSMFVSLVEVVFVIPHCCNMHDIATHRARAAEALISS